MSHLAAQPLASPLTTTFSAATETPLWTPATFTPLKRQRLGKTWRLRVNFSGATGLPTASWALNFYYGLSISPGALIGSAYLGGGPNPNNAFAAIIDALLQIQESGQVVMSGPAGGVLLPGNNEPPLTVTSYASLAVDSALLVTALPTTFVTGMTLTVNTIVFEELEDDLPVLSRGP